ncbi:hypothetical protein ANSO36C_39850 [Nostoc cf. commune SO-36]|uniref:Uncharacterized protein n=1 Tax=Nostoc cf. commune SO-36 TaxID=449208 RepID=A0ABM7Z560_NOSCO|nr:hypothetical protein [Nostoc commune]BDI18183.1 hypothetical protein ANSO36C_39850 [Nostoc cf. commune SO-36]
MGVIVLGLMLLSLTIWLGLLSFWGQFWRTDEQYDDFRLSTPTLARARRCLERKSLPRKMKVSQKWLIKKIMTTATPKDNLN